MLCKICCASPKQNYKKSILVNILRFYQSHYDVLEVSPTCSNKQIKNAFIKLSKKHHPDINKNKESHAKFLKINEAYKVLGKPESRRNYDLGLANPNYNVKEHHYYHEESFKNPYYDPQFWANRDRTKDEFYKDSPYYGINGVRKLPNGAIVICCIILTVIGVGVQFLAITRSFTFQRDELIRRSMEAEKVLNETRKTASINGNNIQLEVLKIKLLRKEMKGRDEK